MRTPSVFMVVKRRKVCKDSGRHMHVQLVQLSVEQAPHLAWTCQNLVDIC